MTIHDAPPADGARDGAPEVSAASAAAAAGVAGEARPGGEPSGGSDLFGLDDGIDDVAPRPRRRRSKLTTALAAVALVGAGVIAGVAADQHWGPDASAATPRVAGFGGFGRAARAVRQQPGRVAPGRPAPPPVLVRRPALRAGGPVRPARVRKAARPRKAARVRAPDAATPAASVASAVGPGRRPWGGWPASRDRPWS